MAFTQKSIKVSITLTPKETDSGGFVQPSFDVAGSDTVTLDGYRAAVQISKPGFPSQGSAQVRIYGMSLSLMNKLSTLGRTPQKRGFNIIQIAAGEKGAESLIFVGNMTQAYTDFGGMPEGIFHIFAFSTAFAAVQLVPPTSFKGSVDVDTVMRNLAGQMGYSYVNEGVEGKVLTNPYYSGSALTQVKAIADDVHIDCYCDNGVLAIWPRDGTRTSTAVPLISPGRGMIGYPYFSGPGLMGVKSEFLREVTYGSQVEVQSSIKPACGLWKVVNLTHDLEAQLPGGQWFTSLTLAPPFSKRIS